MGAPHSADELADLTTAVVLLRRENVRRQADSAERVISRMSALLKRPLAAKVEPDLEVLIEAEGLAMRPGPRPKINREIISALRQAIFTRRQAPVSVAPLSQSPAPSRCALAASCTAVAITWWHGFWQSRRLRSAR
jgi:hypothetical protein